MARSPRRVQIHRRNRSGSKELSRLKYQLGKSHGTFPQQDWTCLSEPSKAVQDGSISKRVETTAPLVESVKTYLLDNSCFNKDYHSASANLDSPDTCDVEIGSPHTPIEEHEQLATCLKRNDLNNNAKGKSKVRKQQTADTENTPNTTSTMPSQTERLQRQPLLARCIKQQDSCLTHVTSDESDPDKDENHLSTHQLPNGDFQIEIPPAAREDRYPKEIWKTVLSFFFLIGCVMVNMLSLSLVHEKSPDRNTTLPLPDIFLDNVPPHDWALNVSEIVIMISTSITGAVVVFHKHRFIVARRLFLIIGLLYFYRSITMYVTVLPVSSRTYYCSPKENHTTPLMVIQRMFSLVSGFGLSINGKHIYCGDYIYSGHTMVLVLCYLIMAEYAPRKLWLVRWIIWLAALAGVIFVLVAHGHYTVDVVIAYYITTRLFWTYHTLASASSRHAAGSGMIAREWWFPIFMYLEQNVRGPIPHRYEWPLPWPKSKLFSRLS